MTEFTAAGLEFRLADYHLRSDSTAIDMATSEGAPLIDIEGNERPYDVAERDLGGPGEGYDIGAYEWRPRVRPRRNASWLVY